MLSAGASDVQVDPCLHYLNFAEVGNLGGNGQVPNCTPTEVQQVALGTAHNPKYSAGDSSKCSYATRHIILYHTEGIT